MLQSRFPLLFCALACALVFPGVRSGAFGQTPPPADTKLSLKAAIVLTPEFCATKSKEGTWGINQENFEIGKVVCADLEPALNGAFAGVTRVEAASSATDAQIILTPKFVDVAATQAKFAFSNRELVLVLEWTAKDASGKTVWIDTVQGSAKHHIGNTFTYKKNLKLIVDDSSKDLAAQSAAKMSASQQLRDLSNATSGAGTAKN